MKHHTSLPFFICLILAATIGFAAAQAPAAPEAAAKAAKTAATTSGAIPRPDHIVIVIGENKDYTHIIEGKDAPYFVHLAKIGANFTYSFAIEHPSQPNYLDLFSGGNQGVRDDGKPKHTPFSTPNLGAQLIAAGFTFAGYSETMPSIGWDGVRHTEHPHKDEYVRKHNPWVNWQDATVPTPANHLPPSVNQRLIDMPTDFSKLPTVSFVIPNEQHDMHSASVAKGNIWLRDHLDAYAKWAMTHNSLLIVTFDENESWNAPNRIPTLFIGQMVKPGDVDRRIDHYDVLRTLEDMYGLPYAGKAAKGKTITGIWRSVKK